MRLVLGRRAVGVLGALFVLASAPFSARAAAPGQGNRACDGLVNVSLTNVRQGPGIEYEVVTQLPYGEKVIAVGLDLTAKWYVAYLPRENNVAPRWIYYRNLRITKQCIKALKLSEPPAGAADVGAPASKP